MCAHKFYPHRKHPKKNANILHIVVAWWCHQMKKNFSVTGPSWGESTVTIHSKMSPAKCQSFCLGLNLSKTFQLHGNVILVNFFCPGCTQTPPFQHCLHLRNLDSDLDYLLIFRCKHSQLLDAQCHVNMACNQWLETWDVAIIYTGGTRICVTVQWMSVDCMKLSPAKLNLIWTAAVNSRVMTGESQTQSWSFTSVHPLHYFVAKTDSYLTGRW